MLTERYINRNNVDPTSFSATHRALYFLTQCQTTSRLAEAMSLYKEAKNRIYTDLCLS